MEEYPGETFETFQRGMRSIDFFRKNSHNFKIEIEPEKKIGALILAFRRATIVLKHFYERKGFKIKEINTVWSLGIKDGYIEEENVWKSMYFDGKEFNFDYDYKTDPELFNNIHDRLFLLLQNFEERFKIEYESISKWENEIDSYTPTTLEKKVEISFISKIKQKFRGLFR